MKKLKWSTSKTLIGQIAAPTCLLAGSAAIVFGISAGTYKLMYAPLDNAEARLNAAIKNNYYSNDCLNQWNMYQKGEVGKKGYIPGVEQPYTRKLDDDTTNWWSTVHHQGGKRWDKNYEEMGINPEKMGRDKREDDGTITKDEIVERRKYGTLLLDGASHVAMDRSFNQSIYNGLINFVANQHHSVTTDKEAVTYKPSQDTTQEFVNIYHVAARVFRTMILSGFNHITPMYASGSQDTDGTFKFDDSAMANAGYILIDGEMANNQNLASVLFRADQPAFLTAIASSIYFYNNLHLYHDKFQNISVATFGGTPIPTVMGYMGGFQRGVEFFNEFILKRAMLNHDAKIYMNGQTGEVFSNYFDSKLLPASKYYNEIETIKQEEASEAKTAKIEAMLTKLYDEYSIKFIKLGDFGTHFTGSFMPGEGLGIVKQYLNRDASAILAVAGSQTLDAVQEVMNQNSKCIVIGVDTPSENSDFQKPQLTKYQADKTVAPDGTTPKQAKNIIKFSAVKDMCEATDKILRLAFKGEHWDNTNTDQPWKSPTPIPAYGESEILKPEDYLQVTFDDTNKEFDIVGFKKDPSTANGAHVLYFPTTFTKENDIYALKNIKKGSSTVPFSADSLKQFDILKLGATKESKYVTFEGGTFDFTGSDAGFRYVDFSENTNIKYSGTGKVFAGMGTKTSSAVRNKGVVKIASKKPTSETSGNFFENEWFIVEPHPTKSTCSFGFKTCGNIENGLVSISWDGWYYLLEGLKHLTLISDGGDTKFMDAFKVEAEEYCTAHDAELSDEFKRIVKQGDYEKLATFDYESEVHKYYPHITLILSQVLDNYELSFPKNLTILKDKAGTPFTPTTDATLSIIEWLRLNMYFTV